MPVNPILTFGAARNGTTFLGNLIAGHPKVWAAKHVLHHGVFEHKVLDNYLFWGDLSDPERYQDFLRQFQIDDSFLLSGLTIEELYNIQADDFFDFFFELVDQSATKANANYWTTKIDPSFCIHKEAWEIFIRRLRTRYKQPYFIGIKREIIPCINSYLKMEGKHHGLRNKKHIKLLSISLGVARYITQYNWIQKKLEELGGSLIRFDDLTRNEIGINQVEKYLSLKINTEQSQSYRTNSSFYKSPNTKIENNKLSIKFFTSFFQLSKPLGKWYYQVYETMKPLHNPASTRIFKSRYFPEVLKRELTQRGSIALLDLINTD